MTEELTKEKLMSEASLLEEPNAEGAETAPTPPEVRLIVTLSQGQSQEIAWIYEPGQDAETLWLASGLLGVNEGIAPALKYLREMCPELAKVPGCYICYELLPPVDDAISEGERVSVPEHAVQTICHLYETGVGHAHQGRRHEWREGALTEWQLLAYELGVEQGQKKPQSEPVLPVSDDPKIEALYLLSDILAADSYRRMTGLRHEGKQKQVADHAAKRAFDLLEACRQSGYSLTLKLENKQ